MIRGLTGFITMVLLLVFDLPVSAQTNVSTTLNEIENLPVKEQVKTLTDLCWQNREKNTDMALEFGLRGVELAKQKGMQKELARLYGYIGVIYQHYKKQTQQAIPFYNEALKLSLQTKDSVQLGYVYNNLGDAFYKIGNVPLALENAKKSMAIFKSLKNDRGIAYSFINLGLVSRINGDYQEALYYFQDAIDIRKTVGDSVGIASASLEIANTLFEMQKLQEAMHYFRESLELHRLLNNKNYMAYSYHGIADVFQAINKFDSAKHYYRQALILDMEKQNNAEIITNLLDLALINAHTNQQEDGEELLNKAMEKAMHAKLPEKIPEVFKTKAEFYGLLEEYIKAIENYERYIDVYDSLYTEQQFQTLQEITNRFEITEELNNINEKLKDKRQEQIYLFIIIVLLGIIATGLIFRYRGISKLNDRLKQSNQTKDKMFSVISHDLISPFNGLVGFSEILMEDLEDRNYDDARNNAQLIFETSNEALQLTRNLLNWARSQGDTIKPSKKAIDIVKLMKEISVLTEKQANNKNIEIHVVTKNPKIAHADGNLIKTVLLNLVNNAIKFTNNNGKIELSAAENNKELVIAVKDNGVGISEENRKKLFKENETLQTVGTNKEKGTGLGLLVCKDFIRLHGGKIWVESESGKGSVFYFTLPNNG